MTYRLTEPEPSTASYVRTGRGGAGNVFRPASSSASSDKPATMASSAATSSSNRRSFFSGIGGAGNVHPPTARPSVSASLDDAVRHAQARDNAPLGYCGRGGAGNVFYNDKRPFAVDARRKGSDASFSSSSTASDVSSRVRDSVTSTTKLWVRRISGKE
ncbi:hypothetical protein RJ55_03734 [Drechmeria coniospora]|nr:hypothetical protein RJ55_03734 [Drechmeria coniospora]